jgi:hypothetical protein
MSKYFDGSASPTSGWPARFLIHTETNQNTQMREPAPRPPIQTPTKNHATTNEDAMSERWGARVANCA